ncbi:MAG: (Fe-S)-binding protein [Deltaproteobacteria bacterium]|nr:(Fe-S)-binding protein [Deltaproteobacteria bacterium]MBW2071081.1 (Fe-S)-binding protein [Deltaproteobacteria bacterium]
MYRPRDIIELIADNVRKSRNPFGAPNFVINRWWKKASLPTTGDAMLYTGLMYQSVPYIEKTTAYLERYEDTALANYVGYGKYMPKFLVGLGFAFLASRQEKKKFNGMLLNVVKILEKSEVDFYYQPDLDFYSGILLYDLGDIDGFIEHARFVASTLKRHKVRKLITVDPHTTYALKVLYPKYVGENFEVHTYFELADFKADNGNGERVTLHDPCFYGRYLELSEVPVKLLTSLGIECVAVRNSGQFTHCCGGPAESISPKLSKEIGDRRIAELKGTGAPIVAMCPICMANLRKGGVEAEDLSTVIAKCA